MAIRTFKIMRNGPEKRDTSLIHEIPWSLIDQPKYHTQAWANHMQTMERLNERGGLDPVELMLIVQGRRWTLNMELLHETKIEAEKWLIEFVKSK